MREQISLIQPSDFPAIDYLNLDPNLFEGAEYILGETTFLLFARKEGGVGVTRLREAVKLAWPKWKSYFALKTPPISIFETDWGLGGGSLGPFKLAVHLRGEYDPASSSYLESILGWTPEKTGINYIQKQFAEFSDPLQAYVNDQIIHELGHIFFLHGILDLKNEEETWFSLGLGLVYDRLIWKEVSEIPSPVFEAFDRVWKNKFSKNLNIDQRLINPDITRDKEFGLVRLQTYGHAKAGAFLSELRLRIGSSKFDEYVKTYLASPVGSPIEYEGFLALFAEDDLKIARLVEREFAVR